MCIVKNINKFLIKIPSWLKLKIIMEEFVSYSVHNICYFYPITEASTKYLICKIGVLTILAMPLKQSVKELLFYYRLQTTTKQIPSQVYFKDFARI